MVIAVELLFVAFGSLEVVLAVAVLEEVVAVLTVEAFTLMVTMTRLPTDMVPMLQFTVVPVSAQVP